MKFLVQGFQKLEADQDRHAQTDVTKDITVPHLWIAKMISDGKNITD